MKKVNYKKRRNCFVESCKRGLPYKLTYLHATVLFLCKREVEY